MELDERGIPVVSDGQSSSEHCPPKPCELCEGNTSLRRNDGTGTFMNSWEWCQEMDTCGATVDWELVFQGR